MRLFNVSKTRQTKNAWGKSIGVGIASSIFAIGLTAAAQADPWVIDFDNTFNNGGITHGQIIDNEYASQIPGANTGVGVSISALNHHNHLAPAVAFDTTKTGTEDPDLQDNFNPVGNDINGNPVAVNGYGNILIIQEKDTLDSVNGNQHNEGHNDAHPHFNNDGYHYKSCSMNDCLSPDDNANGGDLKFVFTTTVQLLGMNIFDIEESGGMVKFYDGSFDNEDLVDVIAIPDLGADRTVGFLGFGENGEGVVADRMIVWFAGSGGIDNVTGQSTTPPSDEVSEPSALAVAALGLVGLAAARRRRKIADQSAMA